MVLCFLQFLTYHCHFHLPSLLSILVNFFPCDSEKHFAVANVRLYQMKRFQLIFIILFLRCVFICLFFSLCFLRFIVIVVLFLFESVLIQCICLLFISVCNLFVMCDSFFFHSFFLFKID